MSVELRSLESLHSFYAEYLTKYKTTSAQRGCMTRDIKAHKEFIAEVEAAIAREGSSKGWYLGDKYYSHHLTHYRAELAAMESIRAGIK